MTATPSSTANLVTDASPPILRAEATDPAGWATQHSGLVRDTLRERGAVLVRGLDIDTPETAGAVFERLGGPLLPDRESFAPRHRYFDHVYSATPWPPTQPMCMHHELSYALECPGTLQFACLRPADSGGATGLADAATMLRALPADLVERCTEHGWLLTRHFNEDIGASVTDVFGTDDHDAIADYCRAHAIEFAFQPDGSLRTRQRRPAVFDHPTTGQRCWFNQLAFLNEWTLDPEVREYLIDINGPDGLPFNTALGDGTPIDADTVATINETYAAHTVRHEWTAGDLLLVDNIATAHSREPHEGARDLVVGMGDAVALSPEVPAPSSASD